MLFMVYEAALKSNVKEVKDLSDFFADWSREYKKPTNKTIDGLVEIINTLKEENDNLKSTIHEMENMIDFLATADEEYDYEEDNHFTDFLKSLQKEDDVDKKCCGGCSCD